jgi:hypothetical protein
MERSTPSTSAAAAPIVTSTQPQAERDATLAAVFVTLTAPAGVAAAFFALPYAQTPVLEEARMTVAVIVAVAPALLFALAADTLAIRALERAEVKPRRARIVRRLALPFALVGAITGLVVVLGATFAGAFLFG